MDLTVKRSRSIGECIYCGTREGRLQREHVVPYGLNGSWTLARASCRACAEITSRFEEDALRSLLPAVRLVLEMQTRRPARRKATLSLIVRNEASDTTVEVPRERYPLYLPTPLFPEPGILAGRTRRGRIFSDLDLLHVAGPTFRGASAEFPGAQFVGAHLNFSATDFARMVAKIAFSGAVMALGLGPFTSTPIRDVILGADPYIGHWVGCWQGESQNDTHGLHAMKVRAAGTDVHVFVRLFAQFGAPDYHVVLGPADPAFVASAEWPWPRPS